MPKSVLYFLAWQHKQEALKLLRSMAHLTLQEVAEGADTSIAYLSKVERNQLVPSDEYVGKIAAHVASELVRRAA